MLVTQLADRTALIRLVRAALRHEVTEVPLASALQHAKPYTLDLRVAGIAPLSLLAEPAGAPANGQCPMRLRPLHRAQAAELYALLENENVASRVDTPRSLEHPDEILPLSRAVPVEGGASDPIARAMSGSAPPPVNVETPRRASIPPHLDPRRTAPSASWRPPSGSMGSVAPRGERTPSWAPKPIDPNDPRQTRESAREAPRSARLPSEPPSWQPGIDDEPSLSVSVVFEPDANPNMRPNAILIPNIPSVIIDGETEDEDDFPGDDGPSLSVSVVFEPDMNPAIDANAPPSSGELLHALSHPPPALDEELAPMSGGSFFDDALANLPQLDLDPEEPALANATARAASPIDLDDLAMVPPAPEDDEAPWGDDDADTLIRLPSASEPALPSAAAAPMPRPMPPRSAAGNEEQTLTNVELPPSTKKIGGTGSGRKKTTHSKKKKSKTGNVDTGWKVAPDPGTLTPSTARRARGESTPDPLVGRKIAEGKYVIEVAIGSGAAGTVYKARHRELRRTVGIKVLHPHYQQDPHFMKSFRGEALAASQLDHPNVMRVLDFGQEPDALVYIVMEFLSGRTLQSLLDEERRLPPDRAVEIMIQTCAALSVAHDHGIIHRDIKPDNIMLVPSRNDEGGSFELVKVCDFGIAALQKGEDASELAATENIIAGTPEYMSPEQARGDDIDARADVYAAGICLYELVTGRPPFLGENPAEILIKQVEEAPKPPSSMIKNLDPLLEEIILRAIQKDPAKRHQSARELRIELKELIDPGDRGNDDDDDERSIVESVPSLDDPGSGFLGFFLLFSSAILRLGRFERGHPEAATAMKELLKATKSALRGRNELTFARRDSSKAIGFCIMTGNAEILDLRRVLGADFFGSHGVPLIELLVNKGIAALTLREGIADMEISYAIEMLLGPYGNEELRKELFSKPLKSVSAIFVPDVVGRDRKLTWKVGLCLSRLVRDLKALSSVRGLSLKKMRETRDDLVKDVARLISKPDEIRSFLHNCDLLDESVANLRGFSAFHSVPLVVQHLHHEPCAETAMLLAAELDRDPHNEETLSLLGTFAARLVTERSIKADAAVTELHRRGIVRDEDLPRDLSETIRAATLADSMVRDPSRYLRMIDAIEEPEPYTRELITLEAAMAVLARRGEAVSLLAAMTVLMRHIQGNGGKHGPRQAQALRSMKTILDKTRLVPVANALFTGTPQQREAARNILMIAASAGAHALFTAREALADPAGRPIFVKVFRETEQAGWGLLTNILPRMEVQTEADIALIEDLLRAMPDRPDQALGEAVSKFLGHPKLRAAALAAIAPLWGERAKKPLLDALEFAEEPARIVAVTELRRMRQVDEQVLGVIERLLTMKGSASEELRAASAAALAEVPPALRARTVALLVKSVEGKRGIVAMIRGEGNQDESAIVIESMGRSLLALDRNEGIRVIKARMHKADGILRARLAALLQA